MVLVRQRMIRVARNAQHFALLSVNANPYTTLRPATKALRHRDHLLRVLLPVRPGVGFGDERVGKNAVTGNFARGSVQQTVYRALCHIPITQAKSHHATYGKAHFKPLTTG